MACKPGAAVSCDNGRAVGQGQSQWVVGGVSGDARRPGNRVVPVSFGSRATTAATANTAPEYSGRAIAVWSFRPERSGYAGQWSHCRFETGRPDSSAEPAARAAASSSPRAGPGATGA